MTEYRLVHDQAYVGIRPIGERAKLSNGTYHGDVYVVQEWTHHLGVGNRWQFVAAFANPITAAHFHDALTGNVT